MTTFKKKTSTHFNEHGYSHKPRVKFLIKLKKKNQFHKIRLEISVFSYNQVFCVKVDILYLTALKTDSLKNVYFLVNF